MNIKLKNKCLEKLYIILIFVAFIAILMLGIFLCQKAYADFDNSESNLEMQNDYVYISGIIAGRDEDTDVPLEGVSLDFIDNDGKVCSSTFSLSDGSFKLTNIEKGITGSVLIKKDSYVTKKLQFTSEMTSHDFVFGNPIILIKGAKYTFNGNDGLLGFNWVAKDGDVIIDKGYQEGAFSQLYNPSASTVWSVDKDGNLVFYNRNGNETTIFTPVFKKEFTYSCWLDKDYNKIEIDVQHKIDSTEEKQFRAYGTKEIEYVFTASDLGHENFEWIYNSSKSGKQSGIDKYYSHKFIRADEKLGILTKIKFSDNKIIFNYSDNTESVDLELKSIPQSGFELSNVLLNGKTVIEPDKEYNLEKFEGYKDSEKIDIKFNYNEKKQHKPTDKSEEQSNAQYKSPETIDNSLIYLEMFVCLFTVSILMFMYKLKISKNKWDISKNN